MKFKNAIVGGTFDHFHKGHEKLLQVTCSQSEKITIGLATEVLYKNKLLSRSIEDFEIRKNSIENFLQTIQVQDRVEIIPLSNIFGNSLEEKNIDAIFVTKDTLKNALLINEKRKQKGFSEVEIIIIPFVLADDGEKISSDRIRLGEIDREGFSYKKFLEHSKVIKLPVSLREELRKPIGEIVQNFTEIASSSARNDIVVSVGDIVTQDLIQSGIIPTISIIDFKTQRHIYENPDLEKLKKHAYRIKNEHGTINSEFANLFADLVQDFIANHKRSTIIVDGEEDLLTLPAILLAPLGSIVIYGQVDIGAVVVEVTEEKKEIVKNLLEKFV